MEYYLPPLLPVIPGKLALVIPANMCYTHTHMPFVTQIVARVQTIVIALTIVCAFDRSAIVQNSHSQSRPPPLSVGIIIPLTGDVAWFGTAFRRGIEMAQAEGIADTIAFSFDDDRSGDRAATTHLAHVVERLLRTTPSILTIQIYGV